MPWNYPRSGYFLALYTLIQLVLNLGRADFSRNQKTHDLRTRCTPVCPTLQFILMDLLYICVSFWMSNVPFNQHKQCAEAKSNKRSKEKKVALHRINGYASRIPSMFFLKILEIRAYNLSVRQHSQFGLGGLNRLCCLTGIFYALVFRILKKLYLEFMKHSC